MLEDMPLYNQLLSKLKKHSGKKPKYFDLSKYLGNANPSLYVSNPTKRKITKEFLAKHKDVSQKEFIDLLSRLYRGRYTDEKSIAGIFLEYSKAWREKIDPKYVDMWLDHLVGWGEVDSLCQSNFKAEEMLRNWNKWKSLIRKLAQSRNINKRRASLVLLTKPVAQSAEKKFSDLAFENIKELERERGVIITKAISWLLRSLIRNHRKKVEVFLKEYAQTLPKIAVRETARKLTTGRK